MLLIDLDPQANATTGLGFRPDELEASTYDLLHGASLDDVVVETSVPNLWLAPSHPDLAAAQVELAAAATRCCATCWRAPESACPTCSSTARRRSGLLTVNALSAANRLIVPVQCEYYALEGLAQLLQSVELVRTRLNPRLGVTGVLLTMYDAPHHARQRRRQRGARALRPARLRHGCAAQHPAGRGTEPRRCRSRRYDARSAGADAYYRVALEVVERG